MSGKVPVRLCPVVVGDEHHITLSRISRIAYVIVCRIASMRERVSASWYKAQSETKEVPAEDLTCRCRATPHQRVCGGIECSLCMPPGHSVVIGEFAFKSSVSAV